MSLPSGYKRLEYIKSTGAQHLDTLFKPNNHTRVVIDFRSTFSTANSPKGLLGSRNSSDVGMFAFLYSNRIDPNYNGVGKSVTVDSLQRHVYDFNQNSFSVDGDVVSFDAGIFSPGYNLLLLSVQNYGTIDNRKAEGYLYSCQIYDNGTLIRDYIPCQTTAGEIGLWDDANSVFYGNAGTGTFTAGPEVDPYGNDENTMLLLHGEDLTDSSPYNHAVTNNGLSIDTSIKKFGKSSLYASATTKNLSIQYNQMFDFGTGDFTFDFWMYLSELVKDITVISGSIKGAYGLGFYRDGKFGLLIPGVEWNIKTDTPALTSGDLNQWVHWAAVRLNGTVYLFKNGTLLKSAALTNSYTLNGGNLALLTEFGNCGIVGYIDEFRISNIARWTENFTPPTKPYSSYLNLHVNIGGTWKNANEAFVNIGGTWKTVEAAFVNIDGTWKELS